MQPRTGDGTENAQAEVEDDVDGSTASQTISFTLDGIEYAIDLNDAHAHELREVFSRYTKTARRTGGRPQTARPRSSKAREVRLCWRWNAGCGPGGLWRSVLEFDINVGQCARGSASGCPFAVCP
ncbi:histone-like nucleoid-structuring protein Lsr2 [Arthrobacter sp.]|uniref:Lsr2 dimerization domain-containing protein n=1 Tax=Arthrobacter sp. TaxID=1667 RepID=UPI003391F9A4